MEIKTAIKKALEGGYRFEENLASLQNLQLGMFLDRTFWQSLGKAMGWGGKINLKSVKEYAWKSEWHRFIDKLASGGTAEQFFEELK